MKTQEIMAIIGTGITGVICLGLSVIFATLAISAPSIGMTIWYGFWTLLVIALVAIMVYQITESIKEIKEKF